jgi:hypothetical protein
LSILSFLAYFGHLAQSSASKSAPGTIADMSGRPLIEVAHISEALALRSLDRQWAK